MKEDKIIMPVVRRSMPTLLAKELCSVQPMHEDNGKIFKEFEVKSHLKLEIGTIIHSFMHGWRIICDDEENDVSLFSEEAVEIMKKYPHEHHERYEKWLQDYMDDKHNRNGANNE